MGEDAVTIRQEEQADHNRVEEIIAEAFADHPHSNQKEHLLVGELRKKEALFLSLIAERDGTVIGHIAFSEVTIAGARLSWYGLAPVAVAPPFQKRGIGSELVRAGLEILKKNGAKGCVLLGEPEFYSRFGFEVETKMTLQGVPPEYFLALSFTGERPLGEVEYHNIFRKYS